MFKRIKRYIKRRFKKPAVETDKKPKEKSPEEKMIDKLVRIYYSGSTAEDKKRRKAVAEDMYSCVRSYGISPAEYIRRGFENVPESERPDFIREISAYDGRQSYPELNNPNYEMFLNRKTAMAEKFRPFYGGDLGIFYDENDRSRFTEFVEKHHVFTYVPSYRIGPVNHKTIDIDETTGADDIFDILIARSCFLALEPLKGDRTEIVRAVTFIADDGQSEILQITAGRSGEIPDRAGAEDLLRKLASVIPQLRLVEWEISYSDDGWVLIDASARPFTIDRSEVPASAGLKAEASAMQPDKCESDSRHNIQNDGKTVISFTGDFSFSGKLDKRYKDPDVVDKKLLDFLNDGDAAIINFESTITDFRDARSVKTGINKRLCHRSDPEALDFIKDSFKSPVLSFGNNHLNDFSDIGIIDTADNTEKSGIRFIGLGRSKKEAFKYEIIGDDIKVGVFSVMYRSFSRREDKEFIGPAHEAMFDQIQETIDDIRKRADYVVIIYHGGTEFCTLPDPEKRELVRKYLDMGCDAVVSHHPHVVQGYEYIGDKPVFYSLGNFFFDTEYQRIQEGTDNGVLLKLTFSADGISFDTAACRIDRDRARVEAGDLSENFRDISDIDYEAEWSKEKEKIENIKAVRDNNRDDITGALYLNDAILIDRSIEKIKLNNRAVYLRDIHQKLRDKKRNIDKYKERFGFGLKSDEHYFAYMISTETGESAEEAGQRLEKVCRYSGIDPVVYYENGLYRLSETRSLKEAKVLTDREKRRNRIIKRICNGTGMGPEDILYDIGRLNIPLDDYYFYGVYNAEGGDAAERIEKIQRINALKEKIKNDTYALTAISEESKKDIAEICDLTRAILSKERKSELMGKKVIESGDPEAEETAVDIHLMRQIWGFYPTEYKMFGFRGMPLESRLSFVSTSMKNDVLNAVSPKEACDVLDNKYLTYRRLADLYGREMVLYDGSNIGELLDFAASKSAFVKKSPFDAMGKGISLVRLPDDPEEKRKEIIALAEESFSADGEFLAEELIEAHESIRMLNPDSVNTVRICTYNDNGHVRVHDSFAKVGRSGSFVDNGGAGGIFVHIDAMTGQMDSDGIDEKCSRYPEHPDNGLVFRDYAFPEWDKALEVSRKAAEKVPELAYVGWDLTYTKDEKWIIVEGNARTQFLGQQATTGKGTLMSFAEVLGGPEELRKYNRGSNQ